MCGILGLAVRPGDSPSLDDQQVARLRDLMTHRGPDSAGIWRHPNIVLAHRRLIVIDPSPDAGQPMLLHENGIAARFITGLNPGQPEGIRSALVYNGELYNDAELRGELTLLGHRFHTQSDTETVLRSFAQWGTEALNRLRGMFALAHYDAHHRLLTLARDPLGIKPLYYAFLRGGRELMFASEIGPILKHPDAALAPNQRMLSAYLMTIRTALGSETLFKGIECLPPGCMLQCDLSPATGEHGSHASRRPLAARLVRYRRPAAAISEADAEGATRLVRSAVSDSIMRHMRADVPVCTLLSGGLDSTIISAVARREKPDLLTYAAGSPIPADCHDESPGSDLHFARKAASQLGTRHAEAHVTRELFNERWPEMVRRLGVPLSTPNEVAINEVARRLRTDGCIVTLSGEGADELFAGYHVPLDAAAEFHAANPGATARDAALHELASCAWVPPDFLPGVLRDERAADASWATGCYEEELSEGLEEYGGDWMAARQRLLRRINLTGLLQRLDTATMLAGVEGRTPFADAEVAALAESLPMWMKFDPETVGAAASAVALSMQAVRSAGCVHGIDAGQAVAPRCRTKRVLREAFAADVPDFIIERPKASFPLPFQGWLGDHAPALRESSFARSLFTDAAIEAVSSQPEKLWRLAWPMINLARWGDAMGW